MKAVATFTGLIKGYIIFDQNKTTKVVTITVSLSGFKHYIKGQKGSQHGWHIHADGDLRNGCESACKHFNPTNKTHGDLTDLNSHVGDFGNLTISDNGHVNLTIKTSKISLTDPHSSIIGRMIIIHEDPDDLGLGHHDDSLTNGHSGRRLACAVIGIAEN